MGKSCFPLGGISRAQRNFSLSFFRLVLPERQKYRRARKIPRSEKQLLMVQLLRLLG